MNWTKTTLPWMSIGYETQCPPISILTFYNAIANNGCMMRPRFVKEIVKDGQVIADYPPVVQRKQIAKPEVIKKLQIILEHVVSQGLGKKAGSDKFLVAGKGGNGTDVERSPRLQDRRHRLLSQFCRILPSQ